MPASDHDHVFIPPSAGVPAWDIDPFAEALLTDPIPYYTELRARGPFVQFPRYGVLACGRYSEVREVFSDWQRFVSSRGVGMSDFKHSKPWRPPSIILEADPPDHTRTRKVMMRVLSPKAVARWKQTLLQAAEAVVDELLQQPEFDAIPALAEVYPLRVFPQRVGLRSDIDAGTLIEYGAIVFNAVGPANALRNHAMDRLTQVGPWIAQLCARDQLSDEGFGAEIYAAADAGEISHDEAAMLVRSLLSAGVDTTVTGIGSVLWCLANNPDEFQRLRHSPEMARPAFEEALRLTSPVHTFFRTANVDTEVSGIAIPRDAKIMCVLGAANLDPANWPAPDRFDIGRRPVGHVAFGAGIHACVGQNVARAEVEALLSVLARRVKAIALAGTPRWKANNSVRALGSLPVRIST